MKISVEKLKANRESLNRQNQQMTLKLVLTSGRSKVTSFIVITMYLELNSVCRGKKHSPFHENTLMLLGLLILIWMSWKKRNGRLLEYRFEQAFVRFMESIHKILSIERETSKRNTCGPGGDWRKYKRLPDQIMHVQKCGGKAAQKSRKQEWATEKPKLDNAREPKGIYLLCWSWR